ncbi:hypothetical protein [Chromobacterium sp. IIBBL 290-4]|nr:hypothetical protein [Chromobacterium sp. IIBBL 290-4]UTH75617.1 hypothetical protein NKT35_05850 [Chromobacterium sp. IIBBL 290-4]
MSNIELNINLKEMAELVDYTAPCEIGAEEVEEISGGHNCIFQFIFER